jgi:hypothetical protein
MTDLEAVTIIWKRAKPLISDADVEFQQAHSIVGKLVHEAAVKADFSKMGLDLDDPLSKGNFADYGFVGDVRGELEHADLKVVSDSLSDEAIEATLQMIADSRYGGPGSLILEEGQRWAPVAAQILTLAAGFPWPEPKN